MRQIRHLFLTQRVFGKDPIFPLRHVTRANFGEFIEKAFSGNFGASGHSVFLLVGAKFVRFFLKLVRCIVFCNVLVYSGKCGIYGPIFNAECGSISSPFENIM